LIETGGAFAFLDHWLTLFHLLRSAAEPNNVPIVNCRQSFVISLQQQQQQQQQQHNH
jgi:hypothetical protein